MIKRLLAALLSLLAAAAFAAVDVNKGTATELDSVKGIGPALSSKIVEERKKGNFKDWQDFVDRVRGVGEGNAAKLSNEGLTVNGATYKGAAPAPTSKAKAETKPAAAAPAAAPAVTTKAADKPAAAASDAKADAKAAKEAAKAEKEAKKKADKEAKEKAKADAKAAKQAAKADKAGAAASAAKK